MFGEQWWEDVCPQDCVSVIWWEDRMDLRLTLRRDQTPPSLAPHTARNCNTAFKMFCGPSRTWQEGCVKVKADGWRKCWRKLVLFYSTLLFYCSEIRLIFILVLFLKVLAIIYFFLEVSLNISRVVLPAMCVSVLTERWWEDGRL